MGSSLPTEGSSLPALPTRNKMFPFPNQIHWFLVPFALAYRKRPPQRGGPCSPSGTDFESGGGPPVPERDLESLQEGGMIPSLYQDENLSTKGVFLPHPLDCGLFCTSTSRDFFSSKTATDSTRRRKEGCRFDKGEFLRRLRKKSLGEDSLLLSGQEITRELSFFLP